jgi:hypothetical protein
MANRPKEDGSGTAVGVNSALTPGELPVIPIVVAKATDSPVGVVPTVPVVICARVEVLSKVKVSELPAAIAFAAVPWNWMELPPLVAADQPEVENGTVGVEGRSLPPGIHPYHTPSIGTPPVSDTVKV